MPEAATSEFWRDLKPIAKVFQPDAKPEVYIAGAPTEDERYYVPFTETVRRGRCGSRRRRTSGATS